MRPSPCARSPTAWRPRRRTEGSSASSPTSCPSSSAPLSRERDCRESSASFSASTGEEESSMPRVREIEDDGGDPILKEVFTKEREIFGSLLNVTKVYAHCPP